jgi:hypothetical protein
MPHAVPVIDFIGVLQVNSLVLGTIEVNAQPIPAVKFLLKQNQPYLILASGHQAGEIYAYCTTALEKGISEIDMKITCTLTMDVDGNFHTITSRLTWYTSSSLREHAAARVLNIFEKGARGEFETCAAPFMKIKSS